MSLCALVLDRSCYEVGKDFGTPIIAIGVWMVAYFQWRTAQRKIALDLFERRMAVYDEMANILGLVVSNDAVTPGNKHAYAVAEHKFGFLFGPDVTERLPAVRKALLALGRLERQTAGGRGSDAQHDARHQASEVVTLFFNDLEMLVAPYLRFHDRVPAVRVWDRLLG